MSNSPRRAVLALYGLVAAMLLGGLLFGKPDERRRNRIARPLRMLSSVLVLVAALVRWKSINERSRRPAGLMAGGMGCGLLGDLILAKVIPFPKPIIGGMLSFGVGHVLYMRALLLRGAHTHLANDPRRSAKRHEEVPLNSRPFALLRGYVRGALAVAWAVSLMGWWVLARRSAVGSALKYGALAYTLLLGSMSGIAAALALRDPRETPAALGGALFFASDAILAAELFQNAHFPGIGDAIWLTYIAGQALLIGAGDPPEA